MTYYKKDILLTNKEGNTRRTPRDNVSKYLRNYFIATLLFSFPITGCNPKTANKQETLLDEESAKIYRKIMEDLNEGGDILKFEMKDNQIKTHEDSNGDGETDSENTFQIFKDGENICLKEKGRPPNRKIHVHKVGSKFSVNEEYPSDHQRKFIFDEDGNIIEYTQQIEENENRLLNILKPIKTIKDKDKHIFAAILSSRLMEQVEYKEYKNYLEIFCKDNEASYIITLRPSNDDEYLGSIIKMGKSAELQTEGNNGSSEFYIFQILDKSTGPTQRFLISTKRVVKDFGGNTEEKFDKSINTQQHKTSNGNVIAGGVGYGINPKLGVGGAKKNDETYTNEISKTSSSEKVENIIYTLNNEELNGSNNNGLELNGSSANPASNADKFQKYYLKENQ